MNLNFVSKTVRTKYVLLLSKAVYDVSSSQPKGLGHRTSVCSSGWQSPSGNTKNSPPTTIHVTYTWAPRRKQKFPRVSGKVNLSPGVSGKVNLNVCRGLGIEKDAEVVNVSHPL